MGIDLLRLSIMRLSLVASLGMVFFLSISILSWRARLSLTSLAFLISALEISFLNRPTLTSRSLIVESNLCVLSTKSLSWIVNASFLFLISRIALSLVLMLIYPLAMLASTAALLSWSSWSLFWRVLISLMNSLSFNLLTLTEFL